MGTTATGPQVAAAGEAAPEKGDRAWIWRVLALVAVFVVIALLRSRQVDIPFRDPHGKLFRAKLPDTALIVVILIGIDILVRWLRSRRESADTYVRAGRVRVGETRPRRT